MFEIIFLICLIFLVYTYFGYPLLLMAFSVFKKKELITTNKQLTAALVIPVYNEEKTIEKKIKNCVSLKYNVNIYFVSDGSTDATNRIIKKHPIVNLIKIKKRKGKANALNSVISKLKEDIVILSDTNTLVDKNAINHLMSRFDDKVGVVCGKYSISDKKTNEGLYWKMELLFRRLENKFGFNLGASGALYAFRKELYERLNKNTIIDDMIIPLKIYLKGYKIVFEEKAKCYEMRKITFKKEFTRRIRVGAGGYQTMIYLSKLLNPFRGMISFAFYSHKVFRWIAPFFMIGLFVSNIFLMGMILYELIFILQALFYLFALLGMFIRQRLFTIPYYFVSMNLAFLIGFFKFIFGLQKATWKIVR